MAGRWADLAVLQNDKAAAEGGGVIEVAAFPKAGQAAVAGTRIRYLPRAGMLGVDSFNYTYVARNGARSSATVTLNITAGSCSPNMCGLNKSAGDCDAVTGRCSCPAGSGLEAAFRANPSLSSRSITPRVRWQSIYVCVGNAIQIPHTTTLCIIYYYNYNCIITTN